MKRVTATASLVAFPPSNTPAFWSISLRFPFPKHERFSKARPFSELRVRHGQVGAGLPEADRAGLRLLAGLKEMKRP